MKAVASLSNITSLLGGSLSSTMGRITAGSSSSLLSSIRMGGQMNFKRLTLTDIKIDIPRIPKKKSLIAAMEATNVKNKWENSSRGRKLIVQQRRASLTDFDRFKAMLAKIKVT